MVSRITAAVRAGEDDGNFLVGKGVKYTAANCCFLQAISGFSVE